MIPAKYLGYAKIAVKLVSSAGVTKIVHDVIANNVTVETTMDTIKVWTGTAVLASTICSYTSENVNRTFDETEEALTEIQNAWNAAKTQK